MSILSDTAAGLTNLSPPPLPCGLDGTVESLKSELESTLNSVIAAYTPGSLIGNLSSLESILKDDIRAAIGTQLTNMLPGYLPPSFIEDVFALSSACALGASAECMTLLGSITSKYTSLGSAENVANLILSVMSGSQADICSKLPNVKIFSDGSQNTLGLTAKISNAISDIASAPADLADIVRVKAEKITNPLSLRNE